MTECDLCKMIVECPWIKEYTHWKLGVCPNQHTLGSLVVMMKTHKESFTELGDEEILEMGNAIKLAEKILDTQFKPDWYNVQQNGNWEHHLHVHIIPRYKEKKDFEGREFEDKTYGQPVTYTAEKEKIEYIEKMTELLKRSC